MHNIQLANEKDRWAGASSCVLLYVYSHMTMNEHDTYTMMQRDHQNNCFMNMQDHDPHIRKRQYCCITKRKPSSAWIWVNQAICSSAGRGKTFLQTGTVTDKILGLCRSHLHLEHLVRCSCEHTSFEQHHGHDFEQFPSSLQIKYTMQCYESTVLSQHCMVYFICSDDGNSSKSCQRCFACWTTVKELHVTLPLDYSRSWKEHLK